MLFFTRLPNGRRHIYSGQPVKNVPLQGLATFTAVAVGADGAAAPADVAAAVTRDTVLVTVMHSNNEIGTVQPLRAISDAARAAHARLAAADATGKKALPPPPPPLLVHTDAAQSMGKVRVDADALGVDLITIVGHKFGAPKGIAALYRRAAAAPRVASIIHGGGACHTCCF